MQLPLAAPQMMLPPPRGQMFMPPPMEWLIMQHDMSIARNNIDGRGEVVSLPLPPRRTTGFAVAAARKDKEEMHPQPQHRTLTTSL
ncbi:Hypothetical predicted protein, partial [Olea europaea subsp. europaea]